MVWPHCQTILDFIGYVYTLVCCEYDCALLLSKQSKKHTPPVFLCSHYSCAYIAHEFWNFCTGHWLRVYYASVVFIHENCNLQQGWLWGSGGCTLIPVLLVYFSCRLIWWCLCILRSFWSTLSKFWHLCRFNLSIRYLLISCNSNSTPLFFYDDI